MMPCKLCWPRGTIGLKQVGKTKHTGTVFARVYRCRDCGGTMKLVGDPTVPFEKPVEEWTPPIRLHLVK